MRREIESAFLIPCTVRKIYMARDGKYSHCAGKFSDTMRVKDQIE